MIRTFMRISIVPITTGLIIMTLKVIMLGIIRMIVMLLDNFDHHSKNKVGIQLTVVLTTMNIIMVMIMKST